MSESLLLDVAALGASSLNAGEYLALLALSHFADEHGFVHETNSTLARWMHYREPSAVSRVLSRLEEKGYIGRSLSGGVRVVYVFARGA